MPCMAAVACVAMDRCIATMPGTERVVSLPTRQGEGQSSAVPRGLAMMLQVDPPIHVSERDQLTRTKALGPNGFA